MNAQKKKVEYMLTNSGTAIAPVKMVDLETGDYFILPNKHQAYKIAAALHGDHGYTMKRGDNFNG